MKYSEKQIRFLKKEAKIDIFIYVNRRNNKCYNNNKFIGNI